MKGAFDSLILMADEVDFVTGNVVRVTDHIEIKQCPYKDKTISFRIDAE